MTDTTREALKQAIARMDRARRILTDGNPTPNCNWGMLDAADLREALAAANSAPPSHMDVLDLCNSCKTPLACQYHGCKLTAANAAEAKPDPVPCGGCGGTGWVVRDPDIGTEQECFACDGTGEFEAEALPAPMDAQPVAGVADSSRNEITNMAWVKYSEKSRNDASLKSISVHQLRNAISSTLDAALSIIKAIPPP